MGIKKPSDYFKEESKDNENLIGKPNLNSYSEAFNSFKEHLSKFDKITDTIKIVDEIKTELQDFLKKEDLDNAMMSYVFLLEENINTLKDNVKSINTKTLTEIKSKVTDVTEVVNEFAEVELPKYKKNIIDAEVRSDKKFNQFKEEFSKLIDEVSTNIDTKQFEIESKTEENLNEVVTNFENKINDLYSGNDGLSKTIKTKVNEIKKLKKDVIEHFKVNKSINKDLTEKISNLEIEIIRGENNIKEQNDDLSNKISNLENEIIKGENNLKEHNDNLSSIEKNIKEELEKDNFVLSTKIKNLEEVYEKLKEESKKLKEESKINETLIEQIIPSTKTSDPLTPLDQNYVTLDQLQEHYRLFLNRIQTQLSTLGGGGETRLQYLDDIVGIATDLSEYNGKFLKVDTSQPAGKNFVFETVSGGGGGGSTGAGGTWATFDSNTGITTTKKVKIANDLEVTGVTTIGNVVVGGATTDLIVNGDARVTGILTIGTGSITLNPTEKKISGIDEIEIGSGTTAITIKKSETGEIQFTDESGDEKSVGIGTTVSINTSGIITATTFTGNLAGTVNTAAQPNITSLGTLSAVTVSGNINANGNIVGDSATNITGIAGVTASTLTGTLQTAAQPNITSVGTLSSLNVTGNVSVGGTLTYEDVTNIDSVGLITARSGIKFGVAGVGGTIRANGDTTLAGVVTASSFSGDLTGTATSITVTANNSGNETVYPVFVDGATGSQGAETDTNLYYNPTSNELTVGSISANTLSATLNINANGNIIGDNSTNISGINSVTATAFFGDGSTLDNVGFTQDSQGNLVAGTGAGASKDADTCYNIMLGCNAGCSLNEGDNNILMGYIAGKDLTSGSTNFLFGPYAGCAINSGSSNFFVGYGIGKNVTTGCKNIAFLGGDSMGATACCNIVMGNEAGYNLDTGVGNIAIGAQAGCDITSGQQNIFLGKTAGANLTTGSFNIALGQDAMGANVVTGSYNLAFGHNAGNKITSGTHQIMIGHLAGACKSCAVEGTVLIGREAGLCNDGNMNIFIGCQSGKSADGGGGNIGLGPKALEINHGNYNIAIGFGAQSSCISSSVGRIIAIGCNVSVPSLHTSCQLVIGQSSNSWIVGNCDFNVGIGTTNPNAAVTSGNTKKLSVGILSAYQLYGDGSNLTNLPAAGFEADSRCNLFAGFGSGVTAGVGTDKNIVMGFCSGYNLNGAVGNIFMGCYIGVNASGNYNIAFGRMSGLCLTTGSSNILMGVGSGFQMTTGQRNIAMGTGNLEDATGSDYNIAIGYENATANDVTGEQNVFIGQQNARRITSGCCNTVIGQCNADCLSTANCNVLIGRKVVATGEFTGNDNVFLGQYVASIATSADYNVMLGHCTGKNLTSGTHNIALGQDAMGAGTISGTHNIVMGNKAGNCIASGSYNIFFGRYAGSTNYGNRNVAIGCMAGVHADGGLQHNVFVGTYAGCCAKANRNIALGYQALKKSTSGGCNVIIGDTAACAVTSGCFNLVSGFKAGLSISSGSCNIFLGKCAGNTTTTGDRNIAIGHDVELSTATGSNQLGIGSGTDLWIEGDSSYNVTLSGIATVYSATGIVSATKFCGDGSALTGISAGGFSPDGQENLYAGTDAGAASDSDTCFNIGIGYEAHKALNSGDNNVAIGNKAGCSSTSGNRNIFLGHYSGSTSTTGSGNVFLGRYIGYGGALNNSAQSVVIGDLAGCKLSYVAHYNVFLGAYAGRCATSACRNTLLGYKSAINLTEGDFNVVIGSCIDVPIVDGNCQLLIGNESCRWVEGDSSYNVTLAGIATVSSATGIVSATKFCGDGSALTGISAGGFSPDDQENLVAGTDAGAAKDADTCYNIMIGKEAGCKVNAGDNNVMIGCRAGRCNESGGFNVFLGQGAGLDTTTGCNVFIGRYAGRCFTTGCRNVAIGAPSGARNFSCGAGTGSFNTTVGDCSGVSITSGEENTLLGRDAGLCVTTGSCNTAVGTKAMGGQGYITGSYNVALGESALCGVCAGSNNIALGQCAGKEMTSGSNNVFLGTCAGAALTTGSFNVAIGCGVCLPSANGSNQFAIGYASNRWITGDNTYNVTLAGIATVTRDTGVVEATKFCGDGSCLTGIAGFSDDGSTGNLIAGDFAGKCLGGSSYSNLFLGCYAGCQASGSVWYNIVQGHKAAEGSASTNLTGKCNLVMGILAGQYLSSGMNNILLGPRSGSSANGSGLSGNNNIAIGNYTGNCLTSGQCNIFLGSCSGKFATTGSGNVAIGFGVTLSSATGNCQLDIGHDTNRWIKGDSSFNVCLAGIATVYAATGIVSATKFCGDGSALTGISAGGFSADDDLNLFASNTCSGCNLDGTNACFNLLLGACAGKSVDTGAGNVFLGAYAGMTPGNSCNNVYIGYNAGKNANEAGCCNVFIGADAGCKKCGTANNCSVAIGGGAMKDHCSSYHNVAIGWGAMEGNNSSAVGNVAVGLMAGRSITSAQSNVLIGEKAGDSLTSGGGNVFLGKEAGQCGTTDLKFNVFVGCSAGYRQTAGCKNVLLGCRITAPISDGSNQMGIGNETSYNSGVSRYWIMGNSNYNVGIGTTNPEPAVGVGNTAKLSVGILSAYQLYGDGSNLTGIPSATRTTNRYIATANQTTFSATYTVGYVDVYLNGIKLDGQDEFTATNGTSVVLTDGATVGDIVEIVAQQVSATLTIDGLSNIVEDTTPQLGGNLDANGKDITGTGDINLSGIATMTNGFTSGTGGAVKISVSGSNLVFTVDGVGSATLTLS